MCVCASATYPPSENELLSLDICLINSRLCHPQTDEKIERSHRSLEDEIPHYKNLDNYRVLRQDLLHFSLDINNYETQMTVFHNKKATDEIKQHTPNEWGMI